MPCQVRVEFLDNPVRPTSPQYDQTSPQYGLLCGEIVDDIQVKVTVSKLRTTRKSLKDLDPDIPALDVAQLG